MILVLFDLWLSVVLFEQIGSPIADNEIDEVVRPISTSSLCIQIRCHIFRPCFLFISIPFYMVLSIHIWFMISDSRLSLSDTQKQFSHIDTNKDGDISPQELADVMSSNA